MSIAINLLYNPTGTDHLDKDFVGIVGLTGELKENVSIVDPIVVIQTTENYIFGYTDENNNYHNGCNYFSIPIFNRYYFLVNIIVLETGLYELHGHVDVLMSHRKEIRNQVAVIKRQETASAYNLYVNDNSLKAYQDPYVITKSFPRGFNGFRYILAVAGVKGSTEVYDPPAISDFVVTRSAGSSPDLYNYTFTWSSQANTDSYQLYVRGDRGFLGAGAWMTMSPKITTNTYSINNRIFNDDCEFAVFSYNDYGKTMSNVVSVPTS